MHKVTIDKKNSIRKTKNDDRYLNKIGGKWDEQFFLHFSIDSGKVHVFFACSFTIHNFASQINK